MEKNSTSADNRTGEISVIKGLTRTDRTLLGLACATACICAVLLVHKPDFDFEAASEIIGEIQSFEKDVRKKSARSFSWKSASTRPKLSWGDSIFTGPESSARLKVRAAPSLDYQEILIAENSLLQLEREQEELKIKLFFGQARHQGDNTEIPLIKPPDTSKSSKRAPTPRTQRPSSSAPKSLAEAFLDLPKPPQIFIPSVTNLNSVPPGSLSEPGISAAQNPVRPSNPALDDVALSTPPVSEKMPSDLFQIEFSQKKSEFLWTGREKIPVKWKSNFTPKLFVVEHSSDPGMAKPRQMKVTGTQWSMERPLGVHNYLRVKAQDPVSQEWITSSIQHVQLKLKKPVLTPTESVHKQARSPAEAAPPAQVRVAWSKLPLIQNYELEISTQQNFARARRSRVRGTNENLLQLQEPGRYHLRVRALDSLQAPASDFSETVSFEYHFLARAPTPALREPASGTSLFFQSNLKTPFWLSWGDVEEATYYRLELSSEPRFQKPLLSQQLQESKFLIPDRLGRGPYFWRVRVEDSKQISNWSETGTFSIFTRAEVQK